MSITTHAATWFLPFAAPLCLYIMFTDLKAMRIPNHAVVTLFAVFVVVGLIALPFQEYLWRYVYFVVALIAGMALTAARAMGAGDAKWIAAMAPFIHLGDLSLFMLLFGAMLMAAYIGHRIAKYSPLRRLAPDWDSWHKGKKFPMGLALGPTLAVYLALGILYGQPGT
ncbi:A24 family peptidase [Sagittula salina]|uniref:Prepilin peptidase n=1 Tax=Sagittula salina TaxID=2820268 RepID=A0A940MNP7_9RHOB|nr:prepilin peptidase [Sagittula salina]MBP0481347.1 prepilin peptidase [Sagittula salina]